MIKKWFGKRELWSKPVTVIWVTKVCHRTVAVGMGQKAAVKELLLRKRQHETLRLARERTRRKKRGAAQNVDWDFNSTNKVAEKDARRFTC